MSHRIDYPLNTTLRVEGAFRDSTGTLLDPDSVIVTLSEILNAYAPTVYTFGVDVEIDNPSIGIYGFEMTYPADGLWTVEFLGTKDGDTVSAFADFGILPG